MEEAESDETNEGEELEEINLTEEQQAIVLKNQGSTEEQDKRSIVTRG